MSNQRAHVRLAGAGLAGLGLAGITLLVAATGCGERAIPELGPNTPRYGEETLKVGLLTVLAPGFGDSGRIDALAAELAVDQVNAAGGVLGRNVELVVVDYAGDNEEARTAARDLVEAKGVVALLAAETSDTTLAVAEAAEELGVPQLSCCATSTEVTAGGDFVFRTAPSDDVQAEVVAQVAAGDEVPAAAADGIKRGAVIYIDNGYGQTFRKNLETAFERASSGKAAPVRVLDYVAYPGVPTSSDLVDAVDRIVTLEATEGQVDFIVLVAFEDSGGELVNTWHRVAGRDVFWIPTDGVYTNRFIEVVTPGAPQAFERMIGTAPSAIPDASSYVFFASTYRSTYGIEPLGFAAHQYDATLLLLLAIQSAGSTDGDAVREALLAVSRNDSGSDPLFRPDQIPGALEAVAEGKDINFEGASGEVDFDDNGDIHSNYTL